MPIPVSITDIYKYNSSLFSCCKISTLIATLPSFVNFRALDYKPNKTYITRSLSVDIIGLNCFLQLLFVYIFSYIA
jgi:hypothetical protein